ncbi:hypothetical protein [Sulfitobacter sp. PS-8MA]|uniref:hypothetical protein n=1 Tax=Sulfitobacter sp. PS-8MA TaxID=3237707 RepID=UPI0034C613D3
MLAAASPNGDGVLEKLRIYLLLRSKDDQYSEVLRNHFLKTLSQAAQVLADPSSVTSSTPPEVLTLAVQCLKDPQISKIFKGIDPLEGPTAQQAGDALKSMEQSFAFSNKPSHFGEGVLAAF